MTQNEFLQIEFLNEVKKQFIKDGWVTICNSINNFPETSLGIYCCLIHSNRLSESKKEYSWLVRKGSEPRFAVFDDNKYESFPEEGIEPFLYYRSFSMQDDQEQYYDVSEEFVLYFNLYEKSDTKQNRTFFFIDSETGNKTEVLKIRGDLVSVQLKYLKEYLTMRDMVFVIQFDSMHIVPKTPSNWIVQQKNKTISTKKVIYNHLIRQSLSGFQSWIMGKTFIAGNITKASYFNRQKEYSTFITGYDQDGNVHEESCKPEEYDGFLKPVFFKKAVLDKYYNDSKRYTVSSYYIHSKSFFDLRADIDHEDYVMVFLGDLGELPYTEQLYWKSYNILRQEDMGISETYYKTMLLGSWNEHPQTPDLFFKNRYVEVNDKWKQDKGWPLFKEADKYDEHLLPSLRLLTNDNLNEFANQTLTLTKLLIDSLNEKELQKGLSIEKNEKGITKLEKYLENVQNSCPLMIHYLRQLQTIRSTISAHKTRSDKPDLKKALTFFGYVDENYKDVFTDMVVKAIWTLNALENQACHYSEKDQNKEHNSHDESQ